MRFISRLIIFISLFIITLSFNILNSEAKECNVCHSDTITAVKYYNHDLINTKDNETILQNLNRNDSLSINNKKDDNGFNGGLNNFIINQTEQYTNLLAYIYNQSYLENKTKVSFITILSEIRPNAP